MSPREDSSYSDYDVEHPHDPSLLSLRKEFDAYSHPYLGYLIFEIKDKIFHGLLSREEETFHINALIHSCIDRTHIEMLLTLFQLSGEQITELLSHPALSKHALRQVIHQHKIYENKALFEQILSHPRFTHIHALYMLEEKTLSSSQLNLLLRHPHSEFFAVAMCIGALHPLSKRTYMVLRKNPHFGQTMLDYIKDNPHISTSVLKQVVRDITSLTKRKIAEELLQKRMNKKVHQ